jgi:predicted metal-dependent enzyme (double-stranded beta helix superfamily)
MTVLDENLITATRSTLEELEAIVTEVGRSPWLWGHAVRFDSRRRSHRVLYTTDTVEVALFGWAAGQETRFHDHGGANGAAFVCSGTLIEDVIEAVDGLVISSYTRRRRSESAFSFGPEYIHRVRHDPALGVALSVHAYTPALSEALDYEVRADGTLAVLEGAAAAGRGRP